MKSMHEAQERAHAAETAKIRRKLDALDKMRAAYAVQEPEHLSSCRCFKCVPAVLKGKPLTDWEIELLRIEGE